MLNTEAQMRITADTRTMAASSLILAQISHDTAEVARCQAEIATLDAESDRLNAAYRRELRESAENRRQATVREWTRQRLMGRGN
jgi:anti-sigma factor RsiW